MLNLFLPLMKEQKFIHKVEKYNNQEIDINFDLFRELPVNIHLILLRWYFHIAGNTGRFIRSIFNYVGTT